MKSTEPGAVAKKFKIILESAWLPEFKMKLNKRFTLLLAWLTIIIIFSYLNLEAMLTRSAEPLCVVCVSMG